MIPQKSLMVQFVAIIMAGVVWAAPVLGQDGGEPPPPPTSSQPVMENVFWNVVWGSAAGLLIGGAVSIIGAQDKEAPPNLRPDMVSGATIGGVVGLAAGVFLVFSGIYFQPEGATLVQADPAAPLWTGKDSSYHLEPLVLETSPADPGKITGFKMLVINNRF
ncbi:MAG: hypothetical protein OEW12_06225 [Deltaproteobacteria bacterium]|nr:hypothetical protein [Deltaproteobacteria bacterium]